jgi:hypothetical protein
VGNIVQICKGAYGRLKERSDSWFSLGKALRYGKELEKVDGIHTDDPEVKQDSAICRVP